MNLSLSPKLTQKVSPKTLQYVSLLQMAAAELCDHLEDLTQENPVLELKEPARDSGDWEKVNWLHIKASRPFRAGRDAPGEDEPTTEYADPRCRETLAAHLRAQLDPKKLPVRVDRAARFIISSLDSRGYLDTDSWNELTDAAGCDTAKSALAVVQSMEPTGVGARSLSECVLLQLRAAEDDTRLAQRIAEKHLDDVAGAFYQKIARELAVGVKAVYSACAQIRKLSPFPGDIYGDGETTAYIVPDVFVDKDMNVSVNDCRIPALNISDYYRNLALTTDDAEVKAYLDDKLSQAKWVLGAIEQRNSTLTGCCSVIVAIQKDFFSSPCGRLVPMKQADVADRLGFHASTISRAICGKYLHCPFGTYPLEYFFTAHVGPASGEEAVSARTAKDMIGELVAAENKANPVSDNSLVGLLEKRGIRVSRRTVTKYRLELGIKNTASRRAEYYAAQ